MLLMRRRPNPSTRRNASKRRGTPPAAGTNRRRGRRASMVEVVASAIDLDIRRVLRCAGDCLTIEEVMDVLARWLGSRTAATGPSGPAPSSAMPAQLRRRVRLASRRHDGAVPPRVGALA